MRVVYSLIGILSIAMQTVAAQQMRCDTLRASVYFPRGFSSVASASNLGELDRFADRLRTICAADDARVSRITVDGWASPDGVSVENGRLSENRARNTARYLADRAALGSSLLCISGHGIDWERLEASASLETDLPHREAVLDVLRNTPVWIFREGRVIDGRMRQLGMLYGGVPYNYLYEHLFPALRRADVCAVVSVGTPPPACAAEQVSGAQRPQTPVEAAAAAPVPCRSESSATVPAAAYAEVAECTAAAVAVPMREPRVALRTNLIYDALLVPNIGIEYRFADRWSAAVDYMHAWWSRDAKHRYWRCYGGEATVRRYFGDRPFAGHHVGLYASALTYDFEFSGRGWQCDGFGFGGGFEYGYSLPVGRRLALDFSVGVGYFGSRYKEYTPVDECYVWLSTRRQHWFGPTRAGISLVWILGGEFRRGKGGAR